jgi:hypothetical protein
MEEVIVIEFCLEIANGEGTCAGAYMTKVRDTSVVALVTENVENAFSAARCDGLARVPSLPSEA